MNRKIFPAVMSVSMVTATFLLSNLLSMAWPHICWLPRIGGLLVGSAVFIQGLIYARKDEFQDLGKLGFSRKQMYMYFANFSAVFGTLIWTFGDLVPQIFWMKNCGCIPTC